MRVAISQSGTSREGSLVRVVVRDVGTWRAEGLTEAHLAELPIVLTILHDDLKQAFREARKAAQENGWTVISPGNRKPL